MLIPGALESINIELIQNLYREITPEVEVLDEAQGIQAERQPDGTMGYSAEYVQAANQVQTDPTSGAGKLF